MTATRAILLCIVLVIIQACADEGGRVVKQVAFNRHVPPAWRSSMRVRQVSGTDFQLQLFLPLPIKNLSPQKFSAHFQGKKHC
ncbi:hypothetical protein OESDEN_08921 [Oesophagostomum dentatum]|uniref:Secreted protein n=1 Tax=Oesophagostomum dentatum TaxID=61180 RepID=A0A0B1T608_OESDE|nr:hypothetical protein OESDEN_08921 [Oesophagostomum dentatum]